MNVKTRHTTDTCGLVSRLSACRAPATVLTTVMAWLVCGCANKYELVKPVVELSALSPELRNLTEARIETYLKADAKPAFPSALAVAKLAPPYYGWRQCSSQGELSLAAIGGDEAQGWRRLKDLKDEADQPVVSQVHFLSTLLTGGRPDLKSLRDAAALVHAPILLAYIQVDSAADGYNAAAIAYWSVVGLFVVPGHTVGHHTVCQALLVDTRSGFILATAQSEAKREENVLPGAVDIARDRTATQAQAEAVGNLHTEIQQALLAVAAKPPPVN